MVGTVVTMLTMIPTVSNVESLFVSEDDCSAGRSSSISLVDVGSAARAVLSVLVGESASSSTTSVLIAGSVITVWNAVTRVENAGVGSDGATVTNRVSAIAARNRVGTISIVHIHAKIAGDFVLNANDVAMTVTVATGPNDSFASPLVCALVPVVGRASFAVTPNPVRDNLVCRCWERDESQ